MKPVAGGGELELGARLDVLTHAVEVLLRRSERQLDEEITGAFTSGDSSVVLLRQIERDRVRELREQLRGHLRPVRAMEGAV